MTGPPIDTPAGVSSPEGVVHRLSPFSVEETVERLERAIENAGAELFSLVDHSGEAERAGLSMRNTKLLVFGNPAAGTPVMQASPLSALDLPLKVLVWEDDDARVWMSFLSGEWLTERHGIPAEIAKPLSAVVVLTARVAES